MKPFHFFLLFVLTTTFHSLAQTKTKQSGPTTAAQMNKLVGTWRLLEFADRDAATSPWTYQFGKHPKGYFTYTKTGIVNLSISAETPLKISRDSAKNYNVNLLNWADHNAESYFGTYTVDFNTSVVTHHVTGGSLPWYTGTDQPRPFMLKGDTLIIGDNIVWKRVLVKVD